MLQHSTFAYDYSNPSMARPAPSSPARDRATRLFRAILTSSLWNLPSRASGGGVNPSTYMLRRSDSIRE